MQFVFNDGGRAAAGFKGQTGDCVTRAIAIATGMPYQEVYDLVNAFGKNTVTVRKGKIRRSNARTGVYKDTTRAIMAHLGWRWVPTMAVGRGCTVHLNANELPKGRIIAKVSKHLVAVIDGVLHDTYNPSDRGATIFTIPDNEEPKPGWRFLQRMGGTGPRQYAYEPERCVYGYWKKD